MTIRFKVSGRAVPKARPRVLRSGYSYTPKSTKDYENRVLESWMEQSREKVPDGVPIRLEVKVKYKAPKSRKVSIGEPHIIRPDLDNIIKAIQDALNGVVYKDDSCVYQIEAEKVYDEEECVEVRIIW